MQLKSVARSTRDQAQMVSTLVCRVFGLPAVPTADWAQSAASAMLPAAGQGPLVVGLGTVGSDGRVLSLEDAGVACSVSVSSLALRGLLDPVRSEWPVTSPEQPELAAGPMIVRMPLSELDGSARAVWRHVGAEELLVGSIPLDNDRPNRRLILLVGVTADELDSMTSRGVILTALLAPLAERMGLAFGRSEPSHSSRRLTAREEEVLGKLMLGLSVKQIADEMERSPHTVHDHVKSLHHKLNASSRGALVARALGHAKSAPLVQLDPVVRPVVTAALAS